MVKNATVSELTFSSQPKPLEEMSKSELDTKLQHSYEQALARHGKPMNEVFDAIEMKQA